MNKTSAQNAKITSLAKSQSVAEIGIGARLFRTLSSTSVLKKKALKSSRKPILSRAATEQIPKKTD